MNLFKLFKLGPAEHRDFGQLFDRIAKLGSHLTETELKEVTAVAGLCGKTAYADDKITPTEISKIKAILLSESKLSAESVDIVLTLIQEQRVPLLTLEAYFYIRLANEAMDKEQKRALLRNLFQIAAADGTICLAEENTLFSMADQLKLQRQEVVALKREFKNFLSVFQSET